MKELKKNYLIVFFDDTYYEVDDLYVNNEYLEPRPPNFKNVTYKVANYLCCDSELFMKSLRGFEEDDVDGMINLLNFHTSNNIVKVYLVSEKLYGN